MSENKKYTIVVKHQRVEVSKAVYYAYHKAREAEKYQDKVSRQFEFSLERFQEDGIHIELQFTICQPTIEDKLIAQEQLQKLKLALASLEPEEKELIYKLFFHDKTEADLAAELFVTQQTISKRKKKILSKLKNMMGI